MKKNFSCRHFFNSLNHNNFRRIEECNTLLKWLEPQPGEYILDIGCGDGYYDTIIAQSGAKVLGLDIQEKPLKTAKELYQDDRCEFLYINAEEMDFEEASFDKVISFCVIEHFHNDMKAMQNIFKSLKPGGWFVFSADSLSNPGITSKEKDYHKKRYAVNTFYTMENIKVKLHGIGFNIEKMRYILTTSYALALVRFSWKLDRLPWFWVFLKTPGYLFLLSLLKINSYFRDRLSIPSQNGLTLLVCAKKGKTG
ncbi:MAG: class I SAM-dependent methyltransferase [Acidobacteria bacterium]|jgi:SAM-dependent methyltransferase|nr:class I SAM-dependent methyltransferase [Acidobacteriota bacterium]